MAKTYSEMTQEYYIDIIGYEGKYQISNMGNIINAKTGKLLKIFYDRPINGYARVSLFDKDSHKNYRVHRLMALHFIPNYDNKKTVNHIDGNKKNNAVSNLEWATQSENVLHYTRVLKKSDVFMNQIRIENKSCGYKNIVHGEDI